MSESASATITDTQISPTEWQYSVTLTDTGSTPLGTFWFAWVPGQDFLDTRPISVTDPAGWQNAITNAGPSDGFAIQWVASSPSADLQPGGVLSGFTFDSADAPSAVFADSVFHPSTPVTTSFVYSGGPFSDPGFNFVATEACFRAGTRILTDRGEVAVEDLLVGDRLQTVLGQTAAPITWIGHRHVDCPGHLQPRQVWPVRVAAGAFGPGRPHRDLFLSPDHAVYVDGVLIPVKHLINLDTITQVPMERVTYYHLELAEHDVLLAEGLPAESYLDMRDGSNYAKRAGPVRLFPDFSARMWDAFGCARLVVTGPELAAARALVAGFSAMRDAA
jgi:hypothetical protein